MRNSTRNIVLAACISGALAAFVPNSTSTLAAEPEKPKPITEQAKPKTVIAVQIKKQGYTCNHPEKATRDKQRSKPHQAVWLLICESGTYRVRLVPDMAAHVERLD